MSKDSVNLVLSIFACFALTVILILILVPKRRWPGWFRHLVDDRVIERYISQHAWTRFLVDKHLLAAIHADALTRRIRQYPHLSGEGLCYSCRHYRGARYQGRDWVLTCDAFPAGIPQDIRDKQFMHTQRHPAQVGETLYEMLPLEESVTRFEKVSNDMSACLRVGPSYPADPDAPPAGETKDGH